MTVRLKVLPAPRRGIINAVSAVLALAVPAVEEVGPALVQAARVGSCGAPNLQRSAAKLGLSFNHLIRSRQQPGRNCSSSLAPARTNARRRIIREVRRVHPPPPRAPREPGPREPQRQTLPRARRSQPGAGHCPDATSDTAGVLIGFGGHLRRL